MLYGAVMTGCLDLVLCLSPISSLRPIVQHRSVFKDIQIPDYFPDLSKLSQRMKFFSIYRDDRVIKVLNILERYKLQILLNFEFFITSVLINIFDEAFKIC